LRAAQNDPTTATTSRGDRSTAAVIATLCLCGTIVALQQTLIVPILPDLPDLLGTSIDNASWLITATLLAGAVATPIVSRLADMVGKRRMMIVCLVTVVAGSLLGALSESLVPAIAARALQGVGMALIPVGIAIMRDELPRAKVPLGVALMSATLAVGAGVGLPLAGIIAAHFDWHAVFWVTVVAGTIMLGAVLLILPESPVKTHGSFDYRGAVVLTVALTTLLLALTKGGHWGWTSAPTIGLAVAGIVLLVVWVPLELRVPSPLVDIRIASRPAVLLVNVASLLVGFAMFANLLVTTQLLQLPTSTGYGLGLGLIETGAWMAPSALVFGALAPFSAWVTRRFGAQTTLISGAATMSVFYVVRVFMSNELWQIVAGSMLVGVGTSLAYAAMPTLIMAAVPITETASANGLNTLLRSIGTSMSSAAVAVVVSMGATLMDGEVHPTYGAFAIIFWLAGGTAAVATLVALPLSRLVDLGAAGHDEVEGDRSVAHGRLLDGHADPVRSAVVNALTADGEQVDWCHVDSAGTFSLALPGPGRYLLVTSADGWVPDSRTVTYDGASELEPIVLHDPTTLSGVVSRAGLPVGGAMVVLIRPEGEVSAATTTDEAGRFAVRTPPNGRYVLTAVEQATGDSASRRVILPGFAVTVDIDLASPSRPTSVADSPAGRPRLLGRTGSDVRA
jgi:MFS family permease